MSRSTRMHGTKEELGNTGRFVWTTKPGWWGHASKELKRRRAASKVAKQARKRNR